MSKSFCLVALVCASAVLANDTVLPTKTGTDQSAAASAGTSQEQERQVRKLHHHPTLFNMLQQSNAVRQRVGLPPQRISPALTAAAQDHANYMARTGQFSHYVNGGPQNRAQRYGFRGGARENIAYGTRSVEGAFGLWVNSPGHYQSIVANTTEAGFGYAISPSGLAYWVGMYGTPPAGDPIGETEQYVAQILEKERQAALLVAAEKATADQDPNVKPTSATVDAEQKSASEVQPAVAAESEGGR